MKVAAGDASPGRALVAEQLPCGDVLAGLHLDVLLLMGVDAAVPVPVVDDDHDRQRRLPARGREPLLVGGQVALPAHEVGIFSARCEDDSIVRSDHPCPARPTRCHGHVEAVVEQLAVDEELTVAAGPERQRDHRGVHRPDVAGQLGGRNRRGRARNGSRRGNRSWGRDGRGSGDVRGSGGRSGNRRRAWSG